MEKAKADENNLTCKVIGEKISTFLLCSLAIRHQENKNDVQPVDRNRAYLNADETLPRRVTMHLLTKKPNKSINGMTPHICRHTLHDPLLSALLLYI